ncbi:MAG: formylglycine-generating enzyme family protein, partial [Rudaea sp.]
MPGTEVVSKQAVYGGAAGIALLAFALIYRFYPGNPSVPAAHSPPAEPAAVPVMSLSPSAKAAGKATPAKPAQVTTEPPPSAPAVPPTKAIAALLKKAAKAFDEGHLTAPKDASALAYYQ